MPDEKPPEKPKKASEEMTVRAFAEAKKLRQWQVLLLSHRVGLDKSMPTDEIEELLSQLSQERI